MKHRLLLAAAVAATLPACSSLPPQASITISPDGRPPLTLTTGKDVRSTVKQAALDFTGWYLRQLINPTPAK